MKKRRLWQILFTSLVLLCTLQIGWAEVPDDEILYQTNTMGILQDGAFQKVITVEEMKSLGDIGTGGFEDLDGELIQVNGTIYRVTADGVVSIPSDDTGITFMNTVRFDPEQTNLIINELDYTSLQNLLNQSFPSSDLIYAIRIDGTFSDLKVRSVPGQEEPYPPLSAVIANQTIFEIKNSTGTITGFWFPAWMQGTNYAGFHLHYLSDDRMAGGHLISGAINNGTAYIDQIKRFQVLIS